MTEFESPAIELKHNASELFIFLSDFNNYQALMPDKVTNWSCTTEECSFVFAGMARFSMKFGDKTHPTKIEIVKSGAAPFDFKMFAFIEEKGEILAVRFAFHADLNPFLKMVAEKPLSAFVASMSEKFKAVMDSRSSA